MSLLRNYLNQHFPGGPDSRLREHFQQIGVRIRQEGNYLQLKYDQIAAKWTEAIMPECRGHILKYMDGSWDFTARPFDKFFDIGEGRCPLFDPKELARKMPELSITEKSDGSCLMLWWDGGWRLSSLGTITTEQVQGQPLTLEDLFWSCLDKAFLLSKLGIKNTYIFELCCPENEVQSRYAHRRVVLLGVRHTGSGELLPLAELPGVEGLISLKPADVGISDIETLRRFVEQQSTDSRWGSWPEGFVLHQSLRPIAKVKNLRYLQRLALDVQDPNPQQVEKKLRQATVLGSLDDLQPFLSGPQKAQAQKLEEAWRSHWASALSCLYSLSEDADTKAYAIEVQQRVFKPLQPFFFQNREAIQRRIALEDALDRYRILNVDRIGASL